MVLHTTSESGTLSTLKQRGGFRMLLPLSSRFQLSKPTRSASQSEGAVRATPYFVDYSRMGFGVDDGSGDGKGE